ncbi:MAG TPA: DUF4142 domain-containing protein [Deinococcales bacterium]|nr:DUF4142 domain-containing protein [Deinococcales bacterium]
MNKRIVSGLMALSMSLAVAVYAASGSSSSKTSASSGSEGAIMPSPASADSSFIKAAYEGDLFEILGAQIAMKKAQSSSVKQLAQTLYNDHTASASKVRALAAKYKVTLSKKLGDEQTIDILALNKKSGKDFDAAYANAEAYDHKGDISLFTDYTEVGKAQDVLAFAKAGLPVLAKHLKMAQAAASVAYPAANGGSGGSASGGSASGGSTGNGGSTGGTGSGGTTGGTGTGGTTGGTGYGGSTGGTGSGGTTGSGSGGTGSTTGTTGGTTGTGSGGTGSGGK